MALSPGVARAETAISLERVAGTACVDARELLQALARTGIRAETHATAEPAARASVTIDGTAQALVVTVRRQGERVIENLPPATCDTATDVVAAFLASALAPPPGMPLPVALDELEAAIGAELAKRGVQLAMLGVRLKLARDPEGNVVAHAEHVHSPGCSEAIGLGVIDTLTEEAVSVAGEALHDALVPGHPCPPPVADTKPPPPVVRTDLAEPARVQALRAAFDRVPRPHPNAGLGTANAISGFVMAAVVLDPTPPPDDRMGVAVPAAPGQRTLLAAGTGILMGGGIGMVMLKGDRSENLGRASMFAGYGLLSLSSFFGGSRFAQQASGTGMLLSSGLAALNIARPLPLTRLSADREAVNEPNLTRTRAAQIEGDLRRAEPFLRDWVVIGPAIAGNTLAAVQSLATGDEPSFLLVVNVTFTATFGFVSVVDAAMGTTWHSYERALRKVGLAEMSLGPGPSPLGLSLSGRF